MLLFSLISSCTEPEEDIILPEGWEKIPGEYQGTVSKTNIYPPHEQIFIDPFEATIVRVDNYYSIEFEKNAAIQLPKLNLEVIDSELSYIYFNIVDAPGYIADNDPIDNNEILINLTPVFGPKIPHIYIRLRMISGDYRISFDGTKWLN